LQADTEMGTANSLHASA